MSVTASGREPDTIGLPATAITAGLDRINAEMARKLRGRIRRVERRAAHVEQEPGTPFLRGAVHEAEEPLSHFSTQHRIAGHIEF